MIKRCPFCGCTPYLEKVPLSKYPGHYKYVVQCDNCGCNIKLPGNDTLERDDAEAKYNAIYAWNKRSRLGSEES